MRRVFACLLALLLLSSMASPGAVAEAASQDQGLPSIADKTEGMEAIDGFMPLYWDDSSGKLWMEIGRWDEEIIYVTALSAGVGSNDIGLDRNQPGGTAVVEFQRIGPKVLMIEPNYSYRAVSDSDAERQAVEEAFARSALWGFTVAAETGDRVLVDATDFVVRDVHGVADRLRQTGQGSYSLDASRSAVWMDNTKGFPKNTEMEAVLTFQGRPEGGWIRSVTPSAGAVTVRVRHSLVEAPPPGFETRESDPRAGFFGVSYYDYATPISEPLETQLINRHRLQKQDPAAEVSDPVEPIVYYLDPGTPEPIRSALLEGAQWWNQAFEAAGYRDAFRVEMLPEDADPLDVRYNIINWVHRSTRGWSYGGGVTDPRTGEIIKGQVALGSLRVRQDFLIAEGLLSPYDSGDEVPPEMGEMALARLRQLSAHEVGHTLGLAHNYIASAQGRASVMDYPHPLVKLREDGSIDLSDAYDTGIGEWDEIAVTYGYQDFPEGTNEEEALEAILVDGMERGYTFISDADARPAGSAHPQVHLWDNGADPAAELQRMMEVRDVALQRFGERAIRNDEPLATIEEALVPLYLHHRYQLEAASKVVGGLYYTYALRGDGQQPLRLVPAAEQQAALDALMATLTPDALALPRTILETLPPRAFRYGPHRELFPRTTGLVFDPVAPAAVAADMTLGMLLHPERAARLVLQPAWDATLPSLEEVLDRVVGETFDPAHADAYDAEVNRVVEDRVVHHLMELADGARLAQARAVTRAALRDLSARLWDDAEAASSADAAHFTTLAEGIDAFLDRPMEPIEPAPELDAPPGSPIGSGRVPALRCDW